MEGAGADVGGEGSGEELDEPDRGGDPERPHAQQPEREPGRPGALEDRKRPLLRRPGITYRPVTGVSPSQVGVTWPPAADASPVIQDFVRYCRDNSPGPG